MGGLSVKRSCYFSYNHRFFVKIFILYEYSIFYLPFHEKKKPEPCFCTFRVPVITI